MYSNSFINFLSKNNWNLKTYRNFINLIRVANKILLVKHIKPLSNFRDLKKVSTLSNFKNKLKKPLKALVKFPEFSVEVKKNLSRESNFLKKLSITFLSTFKKIGLNSPLPLKNGVINVISNIDNQGENFSNFRKVVDFSQIDMNFIKRESLYTKLKYSRSPAYDIVSGGAAAFLAAFIGFLVSEKFGIELVDSGDFYIAFMFAVFLGLAIKPFMRILNAPIKLTNIVIKSAKSVFIRPLYYFNPVVLIRQFLKNLITYLGIDYTSIFYTVTPLVIVYFLILLLSLLI
jgi:hypothetical protein